MIINQGLVKKVKDFFGLNTYETKVWLALLGKGVASAGEIAELSGVPRSRTYDVLEGLEKKGFAIIKLGKPVKYLAVNPNIVIENLKNRTLEKAKEKIKTLSKLKEMPEYSELESLHKGNLEAVKSTALSGMVRGRTNISSYLKEKLNNAEKEILICLSAEEFEKKSKLFSNLFDRLKEKKIKVDVVLKGENDEIKRIVTKYKINPKKTNLNLRFFIIDKKQAIFMLNPSSAERNEDLAMWINSDFFVNSFASMFNLSLKK